MNILAKYVATLGPVGYLPAPGTMASLLTLPLVYWLSRSLSVQLYIVVVFIFTAISLNIITQALKWFTRNNDPSEIVLDEVVGCLVAFVGLPMKVETLVIGFILFRFFDITKCCGIRRCELLFGSWGIVCDDIAAGLLTAGIMHAIILYT